MASLTAVLSTLILSGTIFGFLPDGPNSEGLAEGELFLPPLSATYTNGLSISAYRSTNELYDRAGIGFVDLGKSFSIRRWYFGGSQILELGGAAAVKSYYTDSYKNLDRGTIPLGNDYLLSNHLGFLLNSVVFRLSWNYERKETSAAFRDYIGEPPAAGELDATEGAPGQTAPQDHQDRFNQYRREHPSETPHLLEGDNYEFLVADVRPRLRYYIGVGTYSNINQDLDKRFARYGFDYRGSVPGKAPRLIFGGEQNAYEYNDWDSTYKLSLGVEVSEWPTAGWRATLNWQEGAASYSPYHNNQEQLTGIKASFVF